MDTPVCILVRVSTNEQDNARQVSELEAVATRANWKVVEVIRENGVGGSSRIRPGLARALHLAETKAVRKVMVHEVSRLSRHPAILHDAVERMNEVGVSLYWHAQACETLLPNGSRNPATGMMLAILGEMARYEKENLVARIRSGLAEARRKGRKLGRPAGSTLTRADLLAKHEDIVRSLRAGKALRDIAARTKKGLSTVKRVKVALTDRTPSKVQGCLGGS
ncbi:recombinase family protein [Luteolibacter rhizosphaerae]|uniref:recombinase family protein n=1 Tax=Luteolibacter rhizosphaerae TaxID=2989719 RepID=UPI003CE57D12